MKKLMVAIAGAVAIGFSAVAADWFNGGVAADFPTDTTMTGGAWDDDAADKGEWDDAAKVLVVEADDTEPLTFTATAAKTIGDDAKSVTISSTVKFTPFTTLPEVPEGAKAGVVVFKDLNDNATFYVLAKDDDANVWTDTEIAATADALVNVSVKIEEDGAATYNFGGSEFETTIVTDGTISTANYIGDGEITSLAATYEANTVTIEGATPIANATYVISNNNQQVELPGAVPYGSDVIVTYTANDGYLFAGGAKVWSVTKQATAGGVIATEVSEQGLKEAPAGINGTLFYTVQAAFDAAKADETVTLRTDATEAIDYKGAASFTFDLNGKTLTDSTADATLKNNGTGTITVKDSVGTGKIYNGCDADGKGIAVYARLGAIIVNGGTFKNNTTWEATAHAKEAALVINGGTFINENADPYHWKSEWSKLALNVANDNTGTITVNGGSFSSDPANGDDSGTPKTFLAEKAISQFNASTGLYDAFVPAAKIGTKYYITLQDAVNDAAEYADIYLCSDITLTSRIDIEKPLTICTEGGKGNPDKWFTIYTTATCANGSAFNVTSDLTLKYVKIDGTAVTATECDPITVRKDAVAWIYNVAITINSKNGACVYAFDGGFISIDGDDTFFWNKTTETYEFNPNFKAMTVNQDSNSEAGTQLIEIMGGTFKGQNPADGDDSGNCETFLVEGYTSYWTANGWKVSDAEPEAEIGGVFYLTLKDAVDAVKSDETITLLGDVNTDADIELAQNKTDVVLDLNDSALSLGAAFDVGKNSSLTIKDGAVDATVSRMYFFRSYGLGLTLEDVEIDADELCEPTAGRDLYTGAIMAVNGDVTLKGDTVIENVPDGLYAIAFDNYAGQGYVQGTLDFGTAGIEGDVLISGGLVKNADKATFYGTRFFICSTVYTKCTEATFANSGLVVMTGEFPTTNPTKAYGINITGEAFLSFGDAYTAIDEDEKITCLADTLVAAQTDKGYEIDANGKIVTVTGCIIDEGTVKLVNSKSKAPAMEGSEGGFLINTLVTVKSGAELDMSKMPFGTVYGGVQDASQGAVNLVDGSKATFYYWGNPGWEYVDSPNWMYANMPAFFWGSVIPVGAEVTIGDKTWTGTENGFELEDTVAFAEIEVLGNIGGTTYPLTVNECYASLADAVATNKVGGTVTLAKSIELTARVDVAKSATIDLNECTITRPDGSYSGNGSAFNVTAGTVTIKNGTIDLANLTQTVEQAAKPENECDPITVRSGADVTLEDMTILVDSITGSCAYPFDGGKVTIKSGEYYNATDKTYPWAGGFNGMALNQANVATQLIFVEGGSFKKTNPAAGDDAGLCKTFLAEGYASYKNGEDIWTVAKLPAVTVTDITPAPANLDAAFAYATTDTESAFTDGWKVDFYVSFNANIAENAVTLKGQYGTEQWTGAALPAMTAGVAVPLMQTAGNEVSVEQLLKMQTFNCGVLNVSAPEGTEMTVVLKMYKTATGESFDLATKTYALAATKEAKIGTTYYLTLQDAANDGGAIELLKDVTLAARVEVAKDATFDLGGFTVTPTATCDNGSAFNVTAGTVTIQNGTIDGSAVTTIECDPITVRSGATANLVDGLTVLINTKNGACAYAFDGGRINVTGGVYDNQTLEDYEWKVGIKGMPLNQANVATQLIFVEGGKFRQYNPANGDDSGLCTTFLAEGYVSTKVGEYWEVTEKSGPTPAPGSDVKVDPVPGQEGTYYVEPTGESKVVVIENVQETDTIVVDATKVDGIGGVDADQVEIIATAEMTGKVDPVDISDAFMAVDDGNKVAVVLDPEGEVTIGEDTIPVTPEVDAAAETPVEVTEDTSSVAAHTIPGLTYQLVRGDEPGEITEELVTEGAVKKATGTDTVLVDNDKPDGKAFYKIQVTK